MFNTEKNERFPLENAERSLQVASAIPYNNATSIYEAAGVQTDARFGGSCLFKLSQLRETLPKEAKNTRFVTSVVRKTTHYAMLTDIEGSTYYLDPFLWQKNLLALNAHDGSTVETIQDGWMLQKEKNETDAFLTVSLRNTVNDSVLVTHNFTNALDFLPSSSALPINSELPSFAMQIPNPDSINFYKIWYSKKERQLADIWIVNTAKNDRKRIPNIGPNSEYRHEVLDEIQQIIGFSEQELVEYFGRAHELEKVLEDLIKNSDSDLPHELA